MTGVADALRPFLWLAAVAFAIGFLGYLAASRPAAAAPEPPDRSPRTASAPVSAEWNTPKRV